MRVVVGGLFGGNRMVGVSWAGREEFLIFNFCFLIALNEVYLWSTVSFGRI